LIIASVSSGETGAGRGLTRASFGAAADLAFRTGATDRAAGLRSPGLRAGAGFPVGAGGREGPGWWTLLALRAVGMT
jgi:hypothetical protein